MKSLAHVNEARLQENWKKVNNELEVERENLKNPKLVSMSTRMKINKLEERIEGMARTALKVGIVLTLEEPGDGQLEA